LTHHTLRILPAAVLAALTFVVTASAAPPEQSGKKETKSPATNKATVEVESATNEANAAANKVSEGGIFTAPERDRIAEYYRKNRAVFPSTKPLPPGIAKNLQRGKSLPQGIAKTRLPKTLESSLPKRSGLERYQVGPDVVAVDKAGKLQDILRGVFSDQE
jgi:hypothetical protein